VRHELKRPRENVTLIAGGERVAIAYERKKKNIAP